LAAALSNAQDVMSELGRAFHVAYSGNDEGFAMSAPQNDEAESYLSTKRWFAKHPELGSPGIPVEPFISEEQFALERRRLWPNVWLMVGRVEQIAKPGDYFIREIAPVDASLIVVRGRDRTIRAFHNVCAHRGSKICWEPSGTCGTTTAFKCPYHGFTYDLEGRLKFVPDEKNFYDLDKKTIGLTKVNIDTWEGFIFVHLGPEPRETLRDYIGSIGDGLAGYPFGDQNHQYSYRAVLDCNWKLLISSFLEGYHVRALHAAGLKRFVSKENPYSHLDSVILSDKHRLIALFVNPEGLPTKIGEIAATRYKKSNQSKDSAVTNPDGPPSLHKFIIRNIFPNFQLNLVMGGWYAYQFWPLEVGKVLWEVRMCFSEPLNASQHFFQYYARYASRDNLMEDGNVSEQQHRALKSGVLKKMILQDEEIAVQHFNKVVDDYIRTD
jgi:phenylpropionate dioxygenase-like ring-hydroxylating dioxygenase large terminal subunit